MNRAAISIVGGLMGLLAGTLVVPPLAAFFKPATVVWNGLSCPPGMYTVTALARSMDGGRNYTATRTNVSLPNAAVAVQFPDLAPGAYWVTATSTSSTGAKFTSASQVIDDEAAVTARWGRNRPPANTPTGFARPRNASAPPPKPTEPRLTPPGDSTPPASLGFARPSRGDSELEPLLRRLLIWLNDPTGAGGDGEVWRSVEAIDADDDGVIDAVSIESVTGEIRVFRFVR